jgi:hypothetical protein
VGWFGCPVGLFSLMWCEFDCPVGLFNLMGCEFDCYLEWFGFLECGWSYCSQSGLKMVFQAFKYGLQWRLNLSWSYFDAAGLARYLTV